MFLKSGEKDANGRQASATNKRGYLQRGKFCIWLVVFGWCPSTALRVTLLLVFGLRQMIKLKRAKAVYSRMHALLLRAFAICNKPLIRCVWDLKCFVMLVVINDHKVAYKAYFICKKASKTVTPNSPKRPAGEQNYETALAPNF